MSAELRERLARWVFAREALERGIDADFSDIPRDDREQFYNAADELMAMFETETAGLRLRLESASRQSVIHCGNTQTVRRQRDGEKARAEALRPFDLSSGSLVRAKLLRRAPDEHLLLLTVHHIVADGWSMGIMI